MRAAFVTDIPDRPAFEALLTEFFEIMAGKLAAAGGPPLSAAEAAAGTLSQSAAFLPPRGRLLLAWDGEGALTGCGVVKRVTDEAAEMKHMYVRPAARGTGLGRRLFEMRVAEARRMGLATLYADTVIGNEAMLAIYDKAGFERIERYDENAHGAELAPWLVYLRLDLRA